MFVCVCEAVTCSQIRQVVASGQCSSLRELRQELGVCSQCGCCGKAALELLRQTQEACAVSEAR